MNTWVFEVRDGWYSARLRPDEREVLADVAGQVVELLGGHLDRAVHPPDEGSGRAVDRHAPDADLPGGRRPEAVQPDADLPHGRRPDAVQPGGRRPDADPPEGDLPEGHPLDLVRLGVGPVPAPTDAAVHRLLPDGSRGDAEIAAEFRRLTEDELRSTKVGNLRRLRTLLLGGPSDRVVVSPGEAAAAAAAMTDLRLVVAERLGVLTEEDADDVYRLATGTHEEGHDLGRQFLAVVSVMLGVLQDSLVELMLAAMPDDDAGVRGPGRAGDPHGRPDTDDEPPEPTRAPR
jgi:hypothetical protein